MWVLVFGFKNCPEHKIKSTWHWFKKRNYVRICKLLHKCAYYMHNIKSKFHMRLTPKNSKATLNRFKILKNFHISTFLFFFLFFFLSWTFHSTFFKIPHVFPSLQFNPASSQTLNALLDVLRVSRQTCTGPQKFQQPQRRH